MATTRKKPATTARNGKNGHAPKQLAAPRPNGSADVLFEALGESAAALFAAGRAASDRAHRISTAAIGDLQLTQGDMLSLAQKWAESPLDLLAWYTSIVETAVHTQQRTAESARRLWQELAGAREEARDALQRSTRANWRAGRAAFGLAGEAFRRSNGS